MPTPIADDFSTIAKALSELEAESQHDTSLKPEPYCSNCENGGWECYCLGRGDPHFRECSECGNPEGLPSP